VTRSKNTWPCSDSFPSRTLFLLVVPQSLNNDSDYGAGAGAVEVVVVDGACLVCGYFCDGCSGLGN